MATRSPIPSRWRVDLKMARTTGSLGIISHPITEMHDDSLLYRFITTDTTDAKLVRTALGAYISSEKRDSYALTSPRSPKSSAAKLHFGRAGSKTYVSSSGIYSPSISARRSTTVPHRRRTKLSPCREKMVRRYRLFSSDVWFLVRACACTWLPVSRSHSNRSSLFQ